MKLEDLKKEVAKDLVIHKDFLDDASLATPILHNKYSIFLLNAKDQLNRISIQYKQKYKDKWLYYLGKAPAEAYKEAPFDLKLLKGDINIFLESDQELADLKYKMKYLTMKIEYLDKVLGELGRRSFHISNALKALSYYKGDLG